MRPILSLLYWCVHLLVSILLSELRDWVKKMEQDLFLWLLDLKKDLFRPKKLFSRLLKMEFGCYWKMSIWLLSGLMKLKRLFTVLNPTIISDCFWQWNSAPRYLLLWSDNVINWCLNLLVESKLLCKELIRLCWLLLFVTRLLEKEPDYTFCWLGYTVFCWKDWDILLLVTLRFMSLMRLIRGVLWIWLMKISMLWERETILILNRFLGMLSRLS